MDIQMDDQPKSRILAVEPDPARAATLQRLLRGHVTADFEIVRSCREATESIVKNVPDLILTSTFLQPAEEAALTDSLKQRAEAAHVQLITVPHFIEFEESRTESRPRVLNFLRRREALIRPVCDPRTVREQIEHYLEKARIEKINASARQVWDEIRTPSTALMRLNDPRGHRLTPGDIYTLASGSGPRTPKSGSVRAEDRRRAFRRPLIDIPWLKSVRLPWGLEVGIVNVSTSGILLESSSKITPGADVELQLVGRGLTGVNVPARLIRSEVATVNRMGVKYRVAATFARELDLGVEVAQQVSVTGATPKALANLLVHALADVAIDSRSAAPRTRFEAGLRQLMALREVQLRHAPVARREEDESLYFNVPHESGVNAILQVVFERHHQPSSTEFKLLKAAAGVAGVVLEFAPLQETA